MQGIYDIKQSLVRLYRDYQYTTTVISILALTVAIALFLFTMVYTVQYKPLPLVESPDQIGWATLRSNGGTANIGGLSNFTFEYLKEHQSSFDYFGRIEERMVSVNNGHNSQQAKGIATSVEMFPMLGINPIQGRGLLPSDDVYGAQKVVVLSYRLWDQLYNKSADVVGKTVKIDGELSTIVGVMPPGFNFPINHDLWFADPLPQGEVSHGGWNSVFGRLKPNIKLSEADEQLNSLMSLMTKDYPEQYMGKEIALTSFTDRFAIDMRFLLSMLKIAAIAILLMGAVSVCNLIIVRNLENSKEVLIKLALGIPFARVLAGLFLENFWLCLFGTLIGVWLCFLGISFWSSSLLEGPYWWVLEFKFPVFITGVLAAILLWLFTSVVSLWMAARRPTSSLLAGGRKGGGGAALNKVMVAFSTIQIFSAFVLLVFTGVLVGGVVRIANADYGVTREGYLTAEVKLSGSKYPTLEQRNQYYEKFIDQASRVPGVKAVAVAGALPGAEGYLSSYNAADRNIVINGANPKSLEMPVSVGYFAVMGIKTLDGRYFNAADKAGAEEVAIINKSMAEILFPGQVAVGRQFRYDPENDGKLLTVVGVVPDVVTGNPLWYLSPASKDWRSQLYRPMAQVQPEWDSNTIVLKTERNPYSLTGDMRSVANAIDSETPIYDVRSYDDLLAVNESGFRRLISTFLPVALVAMLISLLGIYSVTRRVVLQNTPNIGIMRAIGIDESIINRKYMVSSSVQMLIALLFGFCFSFIILPRLPDSILITSFQTILIVACFVSVIVACLVLTASYLPLFKAHKMSPRDAMNFLNTAFD